MMAEWREAFRHATGTMPPVGRAAHKHLSRADSPALIDRSPVGAS